MSESVPCRRSPAVYAIQTAAAEGTAVARRVDHVLARSDAARVMLETRLPPRVYFPRGDVRTALRAVPGRRSFCPFKGVATWWDVAAGDDVLSAGAWSYEDPLVEGEAVRGLVAFVSAPDVSIEIDGAPPAAPRDAPASGPFFDWLLHDAPLVSTPDGLVAAAAEQLRAHGVDVVRLSALVWSLHPMTAGRHFVWNLGAPEVETRHAPHTLLDQPAFANSPMRLVAQGLGGVRERLDADPPEFPFPVMHELRARGMTDYVAMPLVFSDGRINVLTLASDRPEGFSTADLGLVFEGSFVLARLLETFSLRASAAALLDTYLGRGAGARILAGEVRRGDGETIEAAVLFCDLRGSTELAARLPRDVYLTALNRFFETVTDCVVAEGGEVLKFVGDGVMAVFPVADDPAAAARHAVSAARAMVEAVTGPADAPAAPPLDCAVGLAQGEVMYGNVGSRERLDFTIVGAAANVATRLCDVGKARGRRIVGTAAVAEPAGGFDPLGPVVLRGVAEPVAAFAIG
ncbi:MAG: DUF427 domain-containing protein [Pseudomonadota bacterium]